jgi:hypothetical protein
MEEKMKKVCRIFEKLGLLLILFAMVACSSYVNDIRVSVNEIEVTFSVEHWKQTVDGKTYELDKNATQSLKGMSMDTTKAKAADFEGFTAQKIDQKTIQRDGSTVVRVYYDRKTITYTFSPAGGNWNGSTDDITVSGLYGAAVPIPDDPAKAGYTFCEWSERIPEVFGAQNLSFTGQWTAGTGTRYKVEHWFQNVSGNGYDLDDTQSENKVGTTQTQTNAQPKYCDGFTGQTITQSLIAADGSTVVKVYYNRNTITYTFNPSGGNWNGSTANITVSGLYGAPVILPALPQKQGYDFNDWDEAVPEAFGAQDLSFICSWRPSSGTAYTVEYWFQNVSGEGYERDDSKTEHKTGTTEGQTNAPVCDYDGFTRKPFEQCVIAADGSSVVKIYYDRIPITYYFVSDWGSWDDGNTYEIAVRGLYGAPVPIPQEPDCEDPTYTFDFWSGDNNLEYFDLGYNVFWANYIYYLYAKMKILPPGTDGSAGPNATYATFGVWPRTIKDKNVRIYELDEIIFGGNTYYQGDDGYMYARCVDDRFYSENDSSTINYVYYSDKTAVQLATAHKVNYFKVEPIKWRVLTTDYNGTGNALLLAEDVLMGGVLFSDTKEEKIIGSEIVYPNNYKYSNVRAYLNGAYEPDDTQEKKYEGIGFLQSAFTEEDQELIAYTLVDNSTATTIDETGKIEPADLYICDNTYDKIFLLSELEMTQSEYGFDLYNKKDNTRRRLVTDYAKAHHVYCVQYVSGGISVQSSYWNRPSTVIVRDPRSTAYWWLRSPSSNSITNIADVLPTGESTNSYSSNSYDPHDGIVPALTISLNN